MHEKPLISIVIVTYNHESEIIPCLKAIGTSTGNWAAEVIVVDNASQDNTVSVVKKISENQSNPRFQLRVIASPENTGFTRGTNLGLEKCRGEFVLLLNPDTRVCPDALDRLMDFLKATPTAGIVAPQLLFPDGSVQPSCRRFPQRSDILWQVLGLAFIFPSSKRFNRWKMGDFSHREIASVEQPQGAALMTQRQAFEKIGYLDEAFPMFFSDVDWCKRFIDQGLEIIFYPPAKVVHLKGSSIYRYRRAMIWSSHKSFIRYFRKHFTGFGNQLLNYLTAILLILLAAFRIALESVIQFFRNTLQAG